MNNNARISAAAVGRSGQVRKHTWGQRALRSAPLRISERIEQGALRLVLPGGEEYCFRGRRGRKPVAEVIIHDPQAIRWLLSGGEVGFAESYLDRQWDTPDLLAVMTFVSGNEQALGAALRGGALWRLINRLYHRCRHNSRRGARRNIACHYDLGNAFYRRWLDGGMTYSSALFEYPEQDLERAQGAKYRRVAELARLTPDAQVLEIGCGWGGFLAYSAARHCHVHGITLSREQLAYANQRLHAAGLAERATATLTDYRDTTGCYDAVVSIEMLEAVGAAHWPRYFQTLYERLKPGACAVIQVITIAQERFEHYRRHPDFIQRHVFPGGMLPTASILRAQAARAGLILDHAETFAHSYARTLVHWRQRFHAAWPQIARQGFDARFRRLWDYYLCYCETGFRTGTINVGLYRFGKAG